MRAKKRNSLTGFTLIEIIMAIILLGIVSVVLGLFVSQQVQAVARADEYALAFNLARSEIEFVNNLAYASITTDNIPNYEGYAGFDMDRTVTATTSGSEEYKTVLVQIRRPGGTENLAALTTYVTKNITFGL